MTGVTTSKSKHLLYLLKKSSSEGRLVGRKKLMKLVFFMEYLDVETDRLVSEKQVGLFPFSIYKYGPFSREVLDAFDKLEESGYLEEDDRGMSHIINLTEEGKSVSGEISSELDPETKRRIDRIAEELGNKTGSELENQSLKYLGITKAEKEHHRGKSVRELI